MEINKQFKDILAKVAEIKKSNKFDLSLEEDLSVAIMNLVSLEEHCYFTGIKLGKDEYFDLLEEIRSVRKSLMSKMIDSHEGETWCISKHLLAATMRMIEVGTKYYASDKKEEAKNVFELGSKIYSLFWALRLKLIDLGEVKKIKDDQLNVHDRNGRGDKPWQFDDIMKKLVDCCNE